MQVSMPLVVELQRLCLSSSSKKNIARIVGQTILYVIVGLDPTIYLGG